MKILTTIMLVSFLFAESTFGQSEAFFCNEWYLHRCSFVDSEQEYLSDVVNRDYKMIFYRDHKVKTNFSLKRQFGTWLYNPDTKQLSITYNETNEIVTMKVFKVSESAMILDYTDENGVQLKLWMYLEPFPLIVD